MRYALSLFLLFSLASQANAQAPLLSGLGGGRDFGTECLHRNDDESSRAIDIRAAFPRGLRFFDNTFTEVFVNTNGNITFGGGVSTFTPDPFPLTRNPTRPMIAPFWADVDTRLVGSNGCESEDDGTCSGGDNNVWWYLEANRMVVTWNQVGYFACHLDHRMNFQLILTGVPACGGGATDFDVEFRFNRCEWETGDASGGNNGFGGTPAQAGFDAGNGRDFVAIMGSRTRGISQRLCGTSNVGEAGVWRFQIRSGTVICPEAGEACSTGMQGVCGEGVTQCVGMGTTCQPVVPSSPERCDSLDNDCNGMADEGENLCGSASLVCDRGQCVPVCFEGGCPQGSSCSADGVCVDPLCNGVTCPAGQRCAGGVCGDICSGVVCPQGQDCRAGRCLDLCDGVSCDPECSVCEHGQCVTRCSDRATCDPGETCAESGLCVPTPCVGVSCPAGMVCGATGCVDACSGVSCPRGESCFAGECVLDSQRPTDAGTDGGMQSDSGPYMPDSSAGNDDAGADAGQRIPGRADSGCGCRSNGAANFAFFALFASMLLRKRRRLS